MPKKSIRQLWSDWVESPEPDNFSALIAGLESLGGKIHKGKMLSSQGNLITVPYIIVYRGQKTPTPHDYGTGYSPWTLDLEIAAGFAWTDGYILSRWVTPEEILGFHERDQEVIVKHGRARRYILANKIGYEGRDYVWHDKNDAEAKRAIEYLNS